MRYALAFAVLAMLSLTACRSSQATSQTARVDDLFAPWNKTDAPGCAVGISLNGATVYEHAYGMANIELGVPMTPSTVLAIASISKGFTAMSVLLAAKQGKLSLDDEVQKYVPEWADKDDHITIRHLATHTSGVRDAFTLLGWSWIVGDQNKAIVTMLARQRGLNSPPGTEYSYNNGGYNLLASILERATGQSLRDFAAANIFKPLGMTHTSFMDEPSRLMPGRAPGYTRHEDGWHVVLPVAGPAVVGNAGMYSTVGDLLLWEQNFETARVGPPELLTAMQTPLVLKNGQTAADHGLGVGLGVYRGAPTVEGSGGDYGMASKVALFPKQRFGVALICNEDHVAMGGMSRVNPDDLAYRIADIYLADTLGPTTVVPATAASSKMDVKLSEPELLEKTGLYSVGGVNVPVLMTVKHGTLMLRSYYGDDFDFELTPTGANRFAFSNGIPFEFIPPGAGRSKQWRVGEGKDQRVWDEVTLALSPAELRPYEGRFHSDELVLTYPLEADGSGLVVRGMYAGDGTQLRIAPFSKDVFVGDILGIVKFSRDARGAITAFTINRQAANGIRFDRVK